MYTPVQMEKQYRAALKNKQQDEARDACDPVLPSHELLDIAMDNSTIPHSGFPLLANAGDKVFGGGRVLKSIKGMGTIYDWRTSPWTPSNGGKIPVNAFVHHIPVVPNMVGIADFIRLRDVLVAQGLMVQTATDREGNVALYTPFNQLCYQARGANSFSTGCEHMHMTTGETWLKKQLRASAWLVQLCKDKHGTPRQRAQLGSGNGVVRVLRRGQTTHMEVSAKAGYNDRSDPGSGYDFEYVDHCVDFFDKHGHFEGA